MFNNENPSEDVKVIRRLGLDWNCKTEFLSLNPSWIRGLKILNGFSSYIFIKGSNSEGQLDGAHLGALLIMGLRGMKRDIMDDLIYQV